MTIIWRNLGKNKELFRQAAKSRQFIIFDTETTGLGKNDEIIELAACKCIYHENRFKVFDTLHVYIKPSIKVPENVTEIHGITNEFLEDKPTAQELFPLIQSFMGESPVVGAYNSSFDIRMLSSLYDRCGARLTVGLEIDLLKIVKDILCEQPMKDHKLGTVANTYGVDAGIEFHNALDDVHVTIRVMNAMIKDMAENGQSRRLMPVKVYKINFAELYRGNSRLYVITSAGVIYYQFKNDKWMPNDEKLNLEKLDMADVERQIFALSGCDDYKSLLKKCKEGTFSSKKGIVNE